MFPIYALYHYYPETFRIRVAITLILLFGGILVVVWLYKAGRIGRHSRNTAILWWVYTLFLLYITVIGRYSFEDWRSQLAPFESYRSYFSTGNVSELRAIILNVVIFISFGALTADLFKEKRTVPTALIAGFVFTIIIEITQFITHTGTFETDDIIHNTIGAALGVLIWKLIHIFLNHKRRNKL